MALPRDRALLVKAARLYYENEMSQDEIAEKLGVSRSNVSRMLTDARAQGIVQIRIVEQANRDAALEKAISDLLPIKNIRVARTLNKLDEFTGVGALGAEALVERTRPNTTIAVSWGSTLQAMVNALDADYQPGIRLVPLVGGMTALSSGSTGEDLIRSMATKMGASFSTLLAPVVVRSPEAHKVFIKEPTVSEVLEQAAGAELAVVGIGSKGASSSMELLHSAGLPDSQYDALTKEMAGDIGARFYDINGKELDHGWSDRIVGISLEQLRRIPFVIGMAAGADKARGVIGAIRGGFISEIIISSSCAFEIIRILSNSKQAKVAS